MKIREILDRLDGIDYDIESKMLISEDTQEMDGARLYATPKGQFGVRTPEGEPAIVANCTLTIEFSQTGRAYIQSGMITTIGGKKYKVDGNQLTDMMAQQQKPTQPQPQQPAQKPPVDPMKAANNRFAKNASQEIGKEGNAHGRRMGWH